MQASRLIVVPVYTDIKNTGTLQQAFCDVMMVESPEAPESYALESDDLPGLAILDSGCSRTRHGEGWSSAFEEELKKIGISVKARDKSQTFKGVGGQTESTVVKIFPFGIGGKSHGYIHSAETPGSTPMLISRPFMKELGTILDLGAGTVSFTKLGVFDLPIIRTKRGHPAVNLLHFNADKLDEFFSETSGPQDELSQQPWHAEEHAEPDSSPQSEQLSAVYGSEEYGYPYTPLWVPPMEMNLLDIAKNCGISLRSSSELNQDGNHLNITLLTLVTLKKIIYVTIARSHRSLRSC